MTETGTVDTKKGSAASAKPAFFKVKLTHSIHNGRTVFRSVSQSRAEQWLMNHCPRGSEMHLEYPDGSTHGYEAERAGENGADADKWDHNFNPEDWIPVDQSEPPGDSIWADKEG